jgi:hypothetical protein
MKFIGIPPGGGHPAYIGGEMKIVLNHRNRSNS